MAKPLRSTRRLEALLKNTEQALFVLNSQRRMRFFNRGCERITGWTSADVIGQKCDYVPESDSHSTAALLALLAPPPTAWKEGPVAVPTNVPHKTADPVPSVIHFFPMGDAEGKPLAMLGLIVPAPSPPAPGPVPVMQRLHAELASLRQSIRRRFGEGSLVGKSAAMERSYGQLKLASTSAASVLFVGEPGVGKQHLARVLHQRSPVGKSLFVPVDCRRAATENLQDMLNRMAADQQGDVLRAGTVYFDFVNESTADFQRMLLDWLRANTGPVTVRVLAGATTSLKKLVDEKTFSRDLFYALSTQTIEVPPLRERMEDLEPLVQAFLEESNRDAELQIGGLTDGVWRQFRRYTWPGNVGELQLVIGEARAGCSSPLIDETALPFRFRTGVEAQLTSLPSRLSPEPLGPYLERMEREQIERALVATRHNKAKAAELLDIPRAKLYRRMEQLGIKDTDETATE